MQTMIDRAPPEPPRVKLAGVIEERARDCDLADERYATSRIQGSEYGTGLVEHAKRCPKSRWNHALPSEFHALVRIDRERQRGLEAWQTEGAQT